MPLLWFRYHQTVLCNCFSRAMWNKCLILFILAHRQKSLNCGLLRKYSHCLSLDVFRNQCMFLCLHLFLYLIDLRYSICFNYWKNKLFSFQVERIYIVLSKFQYLIVSRVKYEKRAPMQIGQKISMFYIYLL